MVNRLSTIIKRANQHRACENHLNLIKTYDNFEAASKSIHAPYWCYWYAHVVVKKRWEQGEPVILRSPQFSYFYSKRVIKGRWEEAENIIFSNGFYKHLYCINFLLCE